MVVMKSLLLVVVLIHIASGFALHAKSKTLANARAGGKVMPGSITGSLRTHKVRVTAAAAAIPAAAPLISPVTAASLRAVAKLLSTVGLGGYASKQGLLNKNALQVLSKLVFGILQPCMLFVNVAQTVSNNAGGGGVSQTNTHAHTHTHTHTHTPRARVCVPSQRMKTGVGGVNCCDNM